MRKPKALQVGRRAAGNVGGCGPDRRSARQRGYSATWDRAAYLFKVEHPLCCGCEAIGQVVPAVVVDHIIPHKGDHALFWDRDNWQACCKWHHDVVKQTLEQQFSSGHIGEAALRLTSSEARRLTLLMMPTPAA